MRTKLNTLRYCVMIIVCGCIFNTFAQEEANPLVNMPAVGGEPAEGDEIEQTLIEDPEAEETQGDIATETLIEEGQDADIQDDASEESPESDMADETLIEEPEAEEAEGDIATETLIEEEPAQETEAVEAEKASEAQEEEKEEPEEPATQEVPTDEQEGAPEAETQETEVQAEEPAQAEEETVPEEKPSEEAEAAKAEKAPEAQEEEKKEPTLPVPPQSDKKAESAEEPEPLEAPKEKEKDFGITTVDVDEPQGNWLFKRIWYEKALAKYDKIKNAVGEILEMRTPYFDKRTELDRTVLDPFYREIGLSLGELKVTIDNLVEQLEKEREDEGMLDADERELLATLEEEQEVLNQLQKDIEAVGSIDENIDTSLKTLMGETNKVRSYEKQAWDKVKLIAQELNDEKARAHFYVVDTLWQNIQDSLKYIKGPFSQYFEQISASAKSNIDRIKNNIAELQQKGIDLKKEAERLEQADQQEEQKETEAKEKATEKEEKPAPKVKKGWFATIKGWTWDPVMYSIRTIYNGVYNGVSAVWNYGMSFFKKAPQPAEPPQEEAPVQEGKEQSESGEQTASPEGETAPKTGA